METLVPYCMFLVGTSTTCVDTLASYRSIAPSSLFDQDSVVVDASSVERCQSACLGRGSAGCAALVWHFATNVPDDQRCVLYTRPISHVARGEHISSLLSVRQTCVGSAIPATTR